MRTTLTAALAALAAAAVPYTFSPGTPARSAEVNANFADLDTRLGTVASGLSAVQAQLAAAPGAAPSKVATADTDAAQLEDGATPPSTGGICNADGCLYRLTAGPFVLTATEQWADYYGGCVAPCPTGIGRIVYFPAPDDTTASSIAAALIARYASDGGARWVWRSHSYDLEVQTGWTLRFVVRSGENLYALHPRAVPLLANQPAPDWRFIWATGHWSGYHPY